MRTIIILSAALAAAAASAPTFAAQWQSIFRDLDGSDEHRYEILLDLASVRVSAAKPTTRIAIVKYERTPPHSNANPPEHFAYSITVKSFACDARRIRLDQSEVHFADGTLQYVDTPRDDSFWHRANDPAAKKILGIVCAMQNPKPEETPTK